MIPSSFFPNTETWGVMAITTEEKVLESNWLTLRDEIQHRDKFSVKFCLVSSVCFRVGRVLGKGKDVTELRLLLAFLSQVRESAYHPSITPHLLWVLPTSMCNKLH